MMALLALPPLCAFLATVRICSLCEYPGRRTVNRGSGGMIHNDQIPWRCWRRRTLRCPRQAFANGSADPPATPSGRRAFFREPRLTKMLRKARQLRAYALCLALEGVLPSPQGHRQAQLCAPGACLRVKALRLGRKALRLLLDPHPEECRGVRRARGLRQDLEGDEGAVTGPWSA